MQYSKTGLQFTEQFESCRLKAYPDQGGVWTIGYGTTIYPTNNIRVKEGDICTQQEATNWLLMRVAEIEQKLNRALLVPVTQEEFDALIDFSYNVGWNDFFKSTLLRLLNSGNYSGAAAEFDKWDHVNGKEVAGLLRRREAETKLFDEVLGEL